MECCKNWERQVRLENQNKPTDLYSNIRFKELPILLSSPLDVADSRGTSPDTVRHSNVFKNMKSIMKIKTTNKREKPAVTETADGR